MDIPLSRRGQTKKCISITLPTKVQEKLKLVYGGRNPSVYFVAKEEGVARDWLEREVHNSGLLGMFFVLTVQWFLGCKTHELCT